jgi:hypothetical protein
MGKFGAAILGLCAGMALTGCGDSDSSRSDRLGGADWTLTITSPQHGSLHRGQALVRVAITGEAAARGDERNFDIGYFVNDELITRSPDTNAQITLPTGTHALRVEGVDTSGQVVERVIGDEVLVEIGEIFQMDEIDVPPSGQIDRRGRAGAAPPPQLEEVDVPDLETPIQRAQ